MKKLILILVLSLFIGIGAKGQSLEYQVKASIIEKFTKFSNWPTSSGLSSTGTPFVITVVGRNPFGSLLDRVYSFKKIKGHSVQIRYLSSNAPLEKCHIIFLASNASGRLTEVVDFAEKHSILTFSDTSDWGKKGICVNLFITASETVHFKINEHSLRKNKIQVNSLLLDYGRSVNDR